MKRFLARAGPAAAIVAAILVCIVLVAWVRLRSWHHRLSSAEAAARQELEEELAKIRARGEPATLAELVPPHIPDDGNAAVGLKEAFGHLAASREVEQRLLSYEDWTEAAEEDMGKLLPKLRELLAVSALAMELAREALQRPRCRFELDYSAGHDMEMPHLPRLRQLARLFKVRAILRARSGDARGAADDLCVLFRLVRTVDGEPVLIPKLVGNVVARMGYDGLRVVERTCPLPGEARRRIIDELRGLDFHRSFAQAMLGERALACSMLRVMEDELGRSWLARTFSLTFGAFKSEEVRMLRLWANMVAATRLPLRDFQAACPKFDPEAEAKEHPAVCMLVGLLLPAYRAAQLRFLGASARRDAAILGLSCELFRSEHGRYPAKLEGLAPEFLEAIPPDPFTGKPFVYRLREGENGGKAFVVYSVGENLTDDGGVRDRDKGKDDIAWEGRVGGP